METNQVHGGMQSVPLSYSNTTATYSEATVSIEDLGISTDWTIDDFKVLSLWFYGSPFNSITEQMYVKLNDAKVIYEGSADFLQQSTWQEWNIDVGAFGIDLGNVATLSIGFERIGAAGGFGTILFDDIRLHTTADQE
jgi:hypothetical protein